VIARIRLSLALAVSALALAGCVAQDGFPSLALRPAERDVSFEPPVRPRIEVPSDLALRTRLAELQGQAAAGNRDFEATVGGVDALAGAAGPPESESWVEAQQALSRLEASRGPTTRALSDLDQLAFARADMATNEEDDAAIEAAVAAVGAIAERQQQRIDRLRTRLGGR
jgi:hypothetical protein